MTETAPFPPLSPPTLAPPLTSPPPATPAPAASSAITAEAIIRAALAANAAAAPGAPQPIDITALLTSLAALPSAAAPAPASAALNVAATTAASPVTTVAPIVTAPSASATVYPPPPPAAAAEDPSLLNDWQAFLQHRAAVKQQQHQLAYPHDTPPHTALSPYQPTHPTAPTPSIKRQKRLYPVHNCGVCLLPCLPFPSARRHCTCCACGVSVHIECYGISKMSKAHSRALRRRWKCERCKDDETRIEVDGMTGVEGGEGGDGSGVDGGTDCMYCPNTRFALKKASNGRYVHVVCALFLPSLAFTLHHLLPFTATTMEERSKKKHRSFLLVTGVNDIPAEQYELACNLCTSPTGLCLQCAEGGCTVSYHVTCAMEAGWCVRVEEEEGEEAGEGVVMRSWCGVHRPVDWDVESEERGVRWVMEGKRLRRAELGEELEEQGGDWEDVDGMEEEEGVEEAVKDEAE